MKLLAWGANSYGQLGVGFKCEQILTPEEIPMDENIILPNNIQSIHGGAGHTVILDKDGCLYTCGWNTKGQLGLDNETLKFTKLEALKEHKIVQVSCGWDFTAALTDEGDVFVWGSNSFRQIGLPKNIKSTSKPTLLNHCNIKYVSCGVRHMALVTKEGKILVCGNGGKGQLGIEDDQNKPVRESDLVVIPDLSNISSVACGQNHTLALKSDGTIYVWGNNKHGQLGIDPNTKETISIPTKLDTNLPTSQVYAGWTHSAILTQDGGIYNFGRNTYGQLGSERESFWVPTKLNSSSVKHLSLGSEHNMAVEANGKLICWGWNEHGNCGTGDTVDVKVPKEIIGNGCVYASAGTGQSFAIVDN